MSPLVRGAWIEKYVNKIFYIGPESPLVRGAWIENSSGSCASLFILVAPRERGVD